MLLFSYIAYPSLDPSRSPSVLIFDSPTYSSSPPFIHLPSPDLSGFHAPDASRAAHWDALEKALTVFVLPGGVRRRVDLIFAAPEAYWTAVVGW